MSRYRREKLAARQLWREFREEQPGGSQLVAIQWPKALMVMGTAVAIAYTTTHRGKKVPYMHQFARGCKPLLCAGKKPGQLYLIGDRFKVDGHGIVDIDARGMRVRDTPTLELVKRRRRGKT